MKKIRLDIGGPKGNAWVIMGTVTQLVRMEGRDDPAHEAKDICARMRGDVFTEDVIRTWIDYKMENEVKPLRARPVPYEFSLYYDI